jgi:hypothetical protein
MLGREWRRVLLYAVLLAFVTLIPYLVGWARAGDDWTFNGFTFGVEDGNSYLGKMQIGVEGDWEFYLFYTPEDHDSAFGLYLPYILFGHIVRWFGFGNASDLVTVLAIAFQVWRVLTCIILVMATYSFIAVFFRKSSTRWFALVLATLGGGLGLFMLIVGMLPVEFYIPEGFSFLVLYGLPHIAIGRSALLIGLLCLFVALRKNDFRYALLTGVCWNLMGLMVTFYLAVIYVILAVWGLALWLRWRRFPLQYALLCGVAAILTAPLFLYNAWLFQSTDAFVQWSSQLYFPSPNPLHYVLGYGLLAAFAMIGGQWAWRRAAYPNGEPYALLVAWVLVTPIMVYLPLNVQRRLAEGVYIPLVVLAVAGMKISAARLSKRSRGWLRTYKRTTRWVMFGLLPSMLAFWIITLVVLLTPACSRETCLFRPRAEREAMAWLRQNADENAVVLGDYRTGNFLAIDTGLRPVYAHGPETLYSEDKEKQVAAFYEGEMDLSERDEWLAKLSVDYVWWGVLEREISDHPTTEGLTVVYDRDGYVIFEVGD